jgi:delta1-piperideine-2-carboxylate reductase
VNTVSLTLNEILELAKKTLLANGCDDENASILADTIMRAERDGSVSHGLFRLPAYVAGLKSKKKIHITWQLFGLKLKLLQRQVLLV